jgi:hypothetical protein
LKRKLIIDDLVERQKDQHQNPNFAQNFPDHFGKTFGRVHSSAELTKRPGPGKHGMLAILDALD